MITKNKIISSILTTIIFFQFLVIGLNNQVQANETSKGTSMYMWEVDGIDYSEYDKIVDYLNINKVYAYIGTADIENKMNYDAKLLFEFAKRKNITPYIVYDENYEDQRENLDRIKTLIKEVSEYNQNSDYKISGIAIDSEFYTMEGYSSLSKAEQIERFANYVEAMKSAYEYAKQNEIGYVVCIPVWLNKLDETQLEELIKNGCDYVQMMNYTKSGMIKNIAEEVELAKKYNKPIENIAEFQIPGPHEVTDQITFYHDGIEACNEKFEEIDKEYNYELLTFSYHYLKPILELAKDVIDYSNCFNYELYAKDKDEKSINISKIYLVSEDEKIQGISLYNEKAKEYIINFYGVEYGKNYKIIIDDDTYELENDKTINYEKSNERIQYDEIHCKLKEKEENKEENNKNNDNYNKTEDEGKTDIDDTKIEEKVESITNRDSNKSKTEDTITINSNKDNTTAKGNLPFTGQAFQVLLISCIILAMIIAIRSLIKISIINNMK